MPTIYRPKSVLSDAQRQSKSQKDAEYKAASDKLSYDYYTKKKSIGVTALETTTFESACQKIWDDYVAWSIKDGLYEVVSLDQQKIEAEKMVTDTLTLLNTVRAELSLLAVAVK